MNALIYSIKGALWVILVIAICPISMAQIECITDNVIYLDGSGSKSLSVSDFTNDACPGCTVDVVGDEYSTEIDCKLAGKRIRVYITIPGSGMVLCAADVRDVMPPSFDMCAAITVGCHLDVMNDPIDSFGIEVSDACGIDTVFPIICGSLPGDCVTSSKVLKIQWQAVDSSGNQATCMQLVTYRKEDLSDVSVELEDTVYCDDATAQPMEPKLHDSITINQFCGLIVGEFEDDTLNMCGPEKLVRRTWQILDACTLESIELTQELHILDSVPPMINCPQDDTLYVDQVNCTVEYQLPTIDVVLNCVPEDAIVIAKYVGTSGVYLPGDVLPLAPGTDTFSIIAADACWKMDTCTFMLTVLDTFAPSIITCPRDTIVVNIPPLQDIVDCDELNLRFGGPALFEDACCSLEVTCELINQIDAVQDTGFILRRYIARDTCNNTADTCAQEIRLMPNNRVRNVKSNISTTQRIAGLSEIEIISQRGSDADLSQVVVWPNPFSDHFWLSLDHLQSEDLQLSITNSYGQIILTRSYPDSSTSKTLEVVVDKASMPNGLYHLILSTASGNYTKVLKLMRISN